MNERDKLLIKANELGLEFPRNVKITTLKRIIGEVENPDTDPVEEILPESPKVKPEPKSTGITDSPPDFTKEKADIAKRRRAAMKTQIVTITNKDNRENEFMTTVQLSMENQHFSIAKIVPLDIPVELETALIKVAESTNMTLHKDQIIDGKRTGNKIPATVKKFAISYAKS